jgi:hypothetical protein
MEADIEKVKARVELLEKKPNPTDREEKELEQKRPLLTALLADLTALRNKEAQLEQRQLQGRDAAGTAFFFFSFFFFFFFGLLSLLHCLCLLNCCF